MRVIWVIITAIVTLAGCQQPRSSVPAKFEIRDFKLDEHKESYGVSVKGRGTLVSADETTKHGTYWVFLSARSGRKNDKDGRIAVILRDGIGTIETFDIPDSGESIQYSGWAVIGYFRFENGTIVASAAN
jgi:hypothetical protein